MGGLDAARTRTYGWLDQSIDPEAVKALTGLEFMQAMLGLIDGPGFVDDGKTVFSYAHPIFWAPFSVVGDGGGSQAGS